MGQRLARQLVAFQHSHAAALEGGTWQVFGVVAGLGQGQGDPELRAFARGAVDADLAAHLLDQAFGNHQAEAGATGLAAERVVGLAEGLEQRAQVFIRQADAGVHHADTQLRAVGTFVLDHGAHDDGAFAGELDRIADQVGQYLLQAQRITAQSQRCVAVDQADQLQLLFMGCGGEDGQGVLQQVAQVEGDGFEHQLARFDLGEIEHLIDDAEQAVGGFLDGRQVILLARAELALLQQVGEAKDAVERGADLVAHVGQELGLDAAGFQSLLACEVQLDVLDLDGFQVLPHVLGGLLNAVLQFFLRVLQGLGHAVDAGGQLIHLMAAQRRQAGFQVAVLELGDTGLDLAQWLVDAAAHTQSEQGGDGKAAGDQQQAGEQAAVAAEQGTLMRKLQFDPAEQLQLAVLSEVVAEHQVLVVDR